MKIPYTKTLLAAFLAGSLCAASASTVSLVNDDFSTGIVGWSAGGTATTVSWGGESDQVLKFATTSTYRGARRVFDSVELSSIGDSLSFSLDIKATTANSTSLGLRIVTGESAKLNNTDRGGYVFTTSWGTASSNNWLYSPTNQLGGTGTTYATSDNLGTSVPLDGFFHNVAASITRVSATHLSFLFTVNGIETGSAVIAATPDIFDMLSIVVTSPANNFEIASLSVSYSQVPEPAAYALALGAVVCVVLVRRRLRQR